MRFLGPLPDGELMKKLAGAYIYVLPSEREGQSIATPEAMAAGTPKAVAAADGNGAVSLVRRAGSGLLVPPNPRALAEGILPPGYVLVYAPRDEEDLFTVHGLALVSYAYAGGAPPQQLHEL